jgi:AcrR family transcriptional regulator
MAVKGYRSLGENDLFIRGDSVYSRRAMAVNAGRPRGVARALAGREAGLGELRRRREEEHARLLRAARTVFLRRGYKQTRVEDVLREAGISTRAFYRFHASKDELFLELFDRANQAAMQRLRDTVARRADPRAQLDAYIDATLDLAYDPRLRRETVLFTNVPAALTEGYAREVAECRDQLVRVLTEILTRGRDAGVFPATEPDDDGWALHGALGAALSRVLRDRTPPDRATLRRRLRRFCHAAVGGPPRSLHER